jgi:hypothetical protein
VKRNSAPLLDAVLATAEDLHKAGLIDGCRMKHYDALCLTSVLRSQGAGGTDLIYQEAIPSKRPLDSMTSRAIQSFRRYS